MTIIKIQRVKNLKATVKYSVQKHKTYDELISTFECSVSSIEQDFRSVLNDYNNVHTKKRNLTARMIIQSFADADHVTPQQAHKIGIEFAQKYLKDEHQYLVVTHIETDHIHNHIIFNDINFKYNKVFDSRREHSLHYLRLVNHEVSANYNLSQINVSKSDKKYMNFREYVVKAKGRSFKEQLEHVIDASIQKAKSYEEFLQLMKASGYEYKMGKHLAFESPTTKRFIRTKTLGIDYVESSIKYRIEHKAYQPLKVNIFKKQWIDKTQEKFKQSKGLERWATIQNINYLNEINAQLYKEKITLGELNELRHTTVAFVQSFTQKLTQLDDEIYTLKKLSGSFEEYKESHSVMFMYKSLQSDTERRNIKTEYNQIFRRYDIVKRNIKTLKSIYNIQDEAELQYKLSLLKTERNLLYSSLNVNTANKMMDLNNQKNKEHQDQHEL